MPVRIHLSDVAVNDLQGDAAVCVTAAPELTSIVEPPTPQCPLLHRTGVCAAAHRGHTSGQNLYRPNLVDGRVVPNLTKIIAAPTEKISSRNCTEVVDAGRNLCHVGQRNTSRGLHLHRGRAVRCVAPPQLAPAAIAPASHRAICQQRARGQRIHIRPVGTAGFHLDHAADQTRDLHRHIGGNGRAIAQLASGIRPPALHPADAVHHACVAATHAHLHSPQRCIGHA